MNRLRPRELSSDGSRDMAPPHDNAGPDTLRRVVGARQRHLRQRTNDEWNCAPRTLGAPSRHAIKPAKHLFRVVGTKGTATDCCDAPSRDREATATARTRLVPVESPTAHSTSHHRCFSATTVGFTLSKFAVSNIRHDDSPRESRGRITRVVFVTRVHQFRHHSKNHTIVSLAETEGRRESCLDRNDSDGRGHRVKIRPHPLMWPRPEVHDEWSWAPSTILSCGLATPVQ